MAINILQPEALALPAPRLPGPKIGHRLQVPAAKFVLEIRVSSTGTFRPSFLTHPFHFYLL